MINKIKIDSIRSLMLFQLIRYFAILLISILLAKVGVDTFQIGVYESFLLVSSSVSFFLVSGFIQSVLATYHRNAESSFFSNIFMILCGYALLISLLLLLCGSYINSVFFKSSEVNLLWYLCVYLLLNIPSSIVEYIYLLKEKYEWIIIYGVGVYLIQIILIIILVFIYKDILFGIFGLLISAGIRFFWAVALVDRFSNWQISILFQKQQFKIALPLIGAIFLSGSGEYVDSWIIKAYFDASEFAIYRYGAKEFPLVILLANSLSNAMVPMFAQTNNVDLLLAQMRSKSVKLMHYLFPVSIVLMISSHWLYPLIFNSSFKNSAIVFNIYLLLIISRLLFPQTILIGNKKTWPIVYSSFVEIIVNITFSLWLIKYWGIYGVAMGTVIAYIVDKLVLVLFVKKALAIPLFKYFSLRIWLGYVFLLLLAFILSLGINSGFINIKF